MIAAENILQILEPIGRTIFVLTSVVLLGFFYGRFRPTDMRAINTLNTDVFIPALIFSVMASKSFIIQEQISLGLAATLVVLGSGLVVLPLCKYIGVHPKTFVPPMMFNNSGNLGLPLIILALGDNALSAAVTVFLVENTLHFVVGPYVMGSRPNPIQLLKQPMIAATVVGVIWSIYSVPIPGVVSISIEMLGQVAVPLLLFALGIRMNQVDFTHWKMGVWSAILAPLSGVVIAIPASFLFNLSNFETSVLILFSVLPPAVLNYVVAERFNQEPESVAAIVLIGNIGSLLIIPLTLLFII